MKKLTTEFKWAVAFTLMGMIWVGGEKLVGLHDVHIEKHPIYTNLIAFPAIALYIFSINEIRRRFYGGRITYKQAVSSGLIITGFITLLSPLAQYITMTYITPDFFKNAIHYGVSHNLTTQADAEAYFNLKSYILQGLAGSAILGVITTLIVSVFASRKNKPVA